MRTRAKVRGARLTRAGRTAAGLLLAAVAAGAAAHERHAEPALPEGAAPEAALAPGWRPLAYSAPEPGSYALPPLGRAADGGVLLTDGTRTRLSELTDGKLSLLAFIYTRCGDVNGCPLATAVMRTVARRVAADDELAERVRLLSLSFDPEYDTPARLAEHARAFVPPGVSWRFLTTSSQAALAPILAAYGQPVTRDPDDASAFSHILRVYLVDTSRRIRNVYSTSFLHADTVVSDIRTLMLESDAHDRREVLAAGVGGPGALGPGDDRRGYEETGFVSRSRALDRREGRPLDLLAHAHATHAGLPPLPVPAGNPLTAGKIALGRKLFYDRRLSHNATLSCAMCHVPEQGFAANETRTSIGIEGRTVRRNAPTLLNVGHLARLFHDGRESTLERQVWQPLLAASEMGNVSIGAVVERIAGLEDYGGLFESAFGGRGPGMETVGQAIASYERALVAGDAPFDRWHYAGEEDAVGDAAKAGFALFTGKAGCAGCHSVGPSSAMFTDERFHDTGVGYARAMARKPAKQRVQLAPGVFVDVRREDIEGPPAVAQGDLGRYEVTTDPADRWRYRTPTLRNVALTAPYMHDGSLDTLEAVVRYYDAGGFTEGLAAPSPGLDARIAPLGLSAAERGALVAFLHSLTSSALPALVADAAQAPVGDTFRAD